MTGGAEHEIHRRRRGRNLAVGGLLLGFVALLFAVTIVKLQDNVRSPFKEYWDKRYDQPSEPN